MRFATISLILKLKLNLKIVLEINSDNFQDAIRNHLYDGDDCKSDSKRLHVSQTRIPERSVESTRFFSCNVWVSVYSE